MDQGDYIRHKARPEWGIGQVLVRSEDRIDVQFGTKVIALKLSVAAPLLESVTSAEARAAGVTNQVRRTGPASTASAARRGRRGRAPVVEEEPEDEDVKDAGPDDDE